MMMKKSLALLLKEEMMERYGLREDQITVELSFKTTDLVLGRQILSDFDKYDEDRHKDYLPASDNSDSVFGKDVHFIAVHRKDGHYGTYVNETEGENND